MLAALYLQALGTLSPCSQHTMNPSEDLVPAFAKLLAVEAGESALKNLLKLPQINR